MKTITVSAGEVAPQAAAIACAPLKPYWREQTDRQTDPTLRSCCFISFPKLIPTFRKSSEIPLTSFCGFLVSCHRCGESLGLGGYKFCSPPPPTHPSLCRVEWERVDYKDLGVPTITGREALDETVFWNLLESESMRTGLRCEWLGPVVNGDRPGVRLGM